MLPQEKVSILSNYARALYEGIIVQNKRMSVAEWAEQFGDTNNTTRVYNAITQLRKRGVFIVNVPRDPMNPRNGNVLVELTESKDVMRVVNQRKRNQIRGRVDILTQHLIEEVTVFPEMKAEASALLRDTIELGAGSLKLLGGAGIEIPKLK